MPRRAIKTIGYTRRSRERDNGTFSLDDQEQRIRAWAQYRDRTLTEVLREDDVSGSIEPAQRPLLGPALAGLQRGDTLVVAKFDRLSRSLGDLVDLIKQAKKDEWVLVCLDPEIDLGTASGRAMAAMLGVFAQLETEQLVERLQGARRAKAAAGGYIGGHRLSRPFGQRLEKGPEGKNEYVPVSEEQDMIEDMVAAYESGVTLRDIAQRMQDVGIRTVTGAAWTHPAVASILRRRGVKLRARGRQAAKK